MRPVARPSILRRKTVAPTASNEQSPSLPPPPSTSSCSSPSASQSTPQYSLSDLKMFTWTDLELMRNPTLSRKRKMEGESRFFSTKKFHSQFAFNNELIFVYLFTTRLLTPDKSDEFSMKSKPESDDIVIVGELDAQTVKSNAVARIVRDLVKESIPFKQVNPTNNPPENVDEVVIMRQAQQRKPTRVEEYSFFPSKVNGDSIAFKLNGLQTMPIIPDSEYTTAQPPKVQKTPLNNTTGFFDELDIPQQQPIQRPIVREDPFKVNSNSLAFKLNGVQSMPIILETKNSENLTKVSEELKILQLPRPIKRPRMEEEITQSNLIKKPQGDSLAFRLNGLQANRLNGLQTNPIISETDYHVPSNAMQMNAVNNSTTNSHEIQIPRQPHALKIPRLTDEPRGDTLAIRLNGLHKKRIVHLSNSNGHSSGMQPLQHPLKGEKLQGTLFPNNVLDTKSAGLNNSRPKESTISMTQSKPKDIVEEVLPQDQSDLPSISMTGASQVKESVEALQQPPQIDHFPLNDLQTKAIVPKIDCSDAHPVNTIGYLKPRKPYQAERMRVRLNQNKMNEEQCDALQQIIWDVGILPSDVNEDIEPLLETPKLPPQEQSDTLEQIVRDAGISASEANGNGHTVPKPPQFPPQEQIDELQQTIHDAGTSSSDANGNIVQTSKPKNVEKEDEHSRVMNIISKVRVEHNERVAQRKREREIILQEVTNTTSYGSLEERPRPRPQQQAERMRVRLIPSNTGAAPPNKGHNEAFQTSYHPKIKIIPRIMPSSSRGNENILPKLQQQPVNHPRLQDRIIPIKVDTLPNNRPQPSIAAIAKHPGFILKQQMGLRTDSTTIKANKSGTPAPSRPLNHSQQIRPQQTAPMAFRTVRPAENFHYQRLDQPREPETVTVRLLPPVDASKPKLSFLNNAFDNNIRLLPPASAPSDELPDDDYQQEDEVDEFRERVDNRKQALLERFEQLLHTDSELAMELKATIEIQMVESEQRQLEEDHEKMEQQRMWERAKAMQKCRARITQSMARGQATGGRRRRDAESEQVDGSVDEFSQGETLAYADQRRDHVDQREQYFPSLEESTSDPRRVDILKHPRILKRPSAKNALTNKVMNILTEPNEY